MEKIEGATFVNPYLKIFIPATSSSTMPKQWIDTDPRSGVDKIIDECFEELTWAK